MRRMPMPATVASTRPPAVSTRTSRLPRAAQGRASFAAEPRLVRNAIVRADVATVRAALGRVRARRKPHASTPAGHRRAGAAPGSACLRVRTVKATGCGLVAEARGVHRAWGGAGLVLPACEAPRRSLAEPSRRPTFESTPFIRVASDIRVTPLARQLPRQHRPLPAPPRPTRSRPCHAAGARRRAAARGAQLQRPRASRRRRRAVCRRPSPTHPRPQKRLGERRGGGVWRCERGDGVGPGGGRGASRVPARRRPLTPGGPAPLRRRQGCAAVACSSARTRMAQPARRHARRPRCGSS